MLYFFSFHLFTCIVNVFVECGCTELLTIYWLLKYKFVFSLLFFLLKLSLTCFTEVLKKDKANNHRNWWKMKKPLNNETTVFCTSVIVPHTHTKITYFCHFKFFKYTRFFAVWLAQWQCTRLLHVLPLQYGCDSQLWHGVTHQVSFLQKSSFLQQKTSASVPMRMMCIF